MKETCGCAMFWIPGEECDCQCHKPGGKKIPPEPWPDEEEFEDFDSESQEWSPEYYTYSLKDLFRVRKFLQA